MKRIDNLTFKNGLRVDELTSADSERLALILLMLNQSKIADSVHLLLEGRTTDASVIPQAH